MPARRLYPIEYAAILGATGLIGIILSPIFARSSGHGETFISCPSNLERIALAMSLYATDYNGFLPSVPGKGANFGWADALSPYLKTKPTTVFQCPAEPDAGQNKPARSGFTDYWFNAHLAGHMTSGIKTPKQAFLCGEGNDGTDTADARYSLSAFPPTWKANAGTPMTRHLGRANYVFADGHFQSLSPLQAANIARFHF